MITRLRLQNFRSHADTEVTLGPIGLLVGPTGAGKSNTFKALALLQSLVRYELAEIFPPGLGDFHWVRSRWAGETDPISFEVDLAEVPEHPSTSFRYHLSIADSPAGLYVLSETLQRRGADENDWHWVFQRRAKGGPMGEFGAVGPYEPSLLYKLRLDDVANKCGPNVQMAAAVAESLSRVGYYHLEASALKQPGAGLSADQIGYHGERLPDFLRCMKVTPGFSAPYQAIHDGLLELLPDVASILVMQHGQGENALALSFKGHKGIIGARDLSDGTLLTLGLLAILHGPKPLDLLCIEEPETGLHPRRLRWLFDQMLQVAYPPDGQRRTQVLLTTHSPDLVDLFSDMPEAVNVVDQVAGSAGQRISRITPLPQILAKLKQEKGEIESIGHAWATGLYESL